MFTHDSALRNKYKLADTRSVLFDFAVLEKLSPQMKRSTTPHVPQRADKALNCSIQFTKQFLVHNREFRTMRRDLGSSAVECA
jgi:hypothetical protein